MALKLYTVVRHDLTPGAQAAQSAHALAALALQYPDEFRAWDNKTIVLLKTQYLGQLEKLIEAAEDGGIKHATFTEPDFLPLDGYWRGGKTDVLTAVAFAPNWSAQHVLLTDLPLALSNPSKKGWFS